MPIRKVLVVDDSKTELMFLTDLLHRLQQIGRAHV